MMTNRRRHSVVTALALLVAIACISAAPDSNGTGPVPAAIRSFVGKRRDLTVIVGEGQQTPPLAPDKAAHALNVLMSGRTYNKSPIACVSTRGVSMTLRKGSRQLELLIDVDCGHIYKFKRSNSQPNPEWIEIGSLSKSGEAELKQVAEDANALQ